MNKLISFALIGSLSIGAMAQDSETSYKMRVLLNDGSSEFYKTSDVKQVDFVEDEGQEQKITAFLAGTDETKDGPLRTVTDQNVAGGGNLLTYPQTLSTDPLKKHPVVIWGPGGGTEPGAYMGMLNRLASQGFVVFALQESLGGGDRMIAAINWLEQQNNDPNSKFYNKLLLDRVGAFGHSMGGLESEQAVIKDKRVVTAFLNNSGDRAHEAMSKVPQEKTFCILYGEGGMERPNAYADYNNPGVKVPACLIKMSGGQGNECASDYDGAPRECGWGHGSGSWSGMACTVAWMRWHIGGESFRRADFIGPNAKYMNGPIVGEMGYWRGVNKNWDNFVDFEF